MHRKHAIGSGVDDQGRCASLPTERVGSVVGDETRKATALRDHPAVGVLLAFKEGQVGDDFTLLIQKRSQFLSTGACQALTNREVCCESHDHGHFAGVEEDHIIGAVGIEEPPDRVCGGRRSQPRHDALIAEVGSYSAYSPGVSDESGASVRRDVELILGGAAFAGLRHIHEGRVPGRGAAQSTRAIKSLCHDLKRSGGKRFREGQSLLELRDDRACLFRSGTTGRAALIAAF